MTVRYNPFLSLHPTGPKQKKNAPATPERSLNSI